MSIVRISKEADKKLGACVGNSIPYFAGECNSKKRLEVPQFFRGWRGTPAPSTIFPSHQPLIFRETVQKSVASPE